MTVAARAALRPPTAAEVVAGLEVVRAGFDPDEKRDAAGKWTAGGAGAKSQTDSPEFKSWFGDSKVVDKDGNPMMVYHGTNKEITSFRTIGRPSTSVGGFPTDAIGAYFSPSESDASGFGSTVMRVYLAIENPMEMRWDSQNTPGTFAEARLLRSQLIKQGYDGIFITSEPKEYIAFHPTQIKSAIGNRGTWSKTDPNITASAPATNLLRAVRAERLARRIEAMLAVKASGGNSEGHRFWGNQWIDHAKDAANDPPGDPSGKIKHSVLVIGGKRYKGPTHFHAMMKFKGDIDSAKITREGFETSSGHFLDRKQASKYIGVTKPNYQMSAEVLDALNGIRATSIGGALYTRDAVMAEDHSDDTAQSAKAIVKDAGGLVLILKDDQGRWDLPGGHLRAGETLQDGVRREALEETGLSISVGAQKPIYGPGQPASVFEATVPGHKPHVTLSGEHVAYKWVREARAEKLAAFWLPGATAARFAGHDAVRDEAEQTISKAVSRVVALAEAKAVTEKRNERRDDEFYAAAALLFAGALAHAYGTAAQKLAVQAQGADHGETLTEAEEEDYAAGRADLLTGFPERLRDTLDLEVKRGEAAGESHGAISRRVREAGEEFEQGAGRTVAATEAQAVYGSAQLRALARAGYTTKFWVTEQDERVRDSHNACEAQGDIPVGKKFSNGLLYPGDPAGGPAECANCRCWLEPGSKRPRGEHRATGETMNQGSGPNAAETVMAANFDEAKHPRGNVKNKGEFGHGGGGFSLPTTEDLVARVREQSIGKSGGVEIKREVDKEKSKSEVEKETGGTDSKAFKAWFGDSKVVDKDGRPLVVYHGTSSPENFEKFDRTGSHDSGWFGKGYYFTTNAKSASEYARGYTGSQNTENARIIPVYVSLRNPMVAHDRNDVANKLQKLGGDPNLEGAALTKELKRFGFDGAIIDGGKEIAVFDNTQIKSAIGNRGTWSKTNPNITAREVTL